MALTNHINENTMAKKFIVLLTSEIDTVVFDKVEETSEETVFKSVDGTQFFVELLDENDCVFLNEMTVVARLDKSEIEELQKSVNWKKRTINF